MKKRKEKGAHRQLHKKKRSEILTNRIDTDIQTKKKRMSTLIFHQDLFIVFSKYTNKRKTSLCVVQYELPR